MCSYSKNIGCDPICTHDCDGCEWNEDDGEEIVTVIVYPQKDNIKVMVYPQVEGITPTVIEKGNDNGR